MSTAQTESRPDLHQLLGASPKRPGRRKLWIALIVLALIAVLALGALLLPGKNSKGPRYVTAPVTRGDLTVTVSATGNLQPINTVDVGSETSGTVAKVLVDYNDKVRKGQVLAQLDTTKLELQIERTRATLASNQARSAQARATLAENKASLARLEEVARLSGGKVPSATELDAARASFARAQADLASTEAAVRESTAALKSNETDLAKATIRSPINGIVLKRSIEPGQTVAASLQAPVLFSLAEDLTEMKLIVSVAEADVGQVKENLSASFTVDAYSDKTFPAKISQVRYGSTTVDNVVSYQTVLLVDNKALRLRPGMTATADIKVAERKDVLLVPNAALRFKPARLEKKEASGGVLSFLFPRPPSMRPERQGGGRGEATKAKRSETRVWIKTPQGIRPVRVKARLSDGHNTEIETDQLKPGDEVIVDSEEAAK